MTPLQKKFLKYAAVIGGYAFLIEILRQSCKACKFLWSEHKSLYDFHAIVLEKAIEENPNFLDDPDLQAFIVNYQFANIMNHYEV